MSRGFTIFLLILVNLAPRFAFAQGELWKELFEKGRAAYLKQNYDTAAKILEVSLQKARKENGTEHPNYDSSLNRLASTYYDMGNFTGAESAFYEIVNIRAKTVGKENHDYVNSLAGLAFTYFVLGKYSKAEPVFLNIRDIVLKTEGKDHYEYPYSLNNLAVLYIKMGDYAKAEKFYLEAVPLEAKILGRQNPEYAIAILNLGELYCEMGNYAKGEPLYLEVLKIQEKSLGKENPDYALTLNNLAMLYHDKGNYSKVEPLYLEALRIWEKVSKTKDPSYITALNNLAGFYDEMGNYPKAESYFFKTLEIRAATQGKEHDSYASSLNNLAVHYYQMGDYEKANKYCVESLDIRARVLGKDHPEYSRSVSTLGSIYMATKKYTEAVPLFLEANRIILKNFGKLHPDYAASMDNLASVYKRLGNLAKAESLYVESKELTAQSLGKKHPFYIRDINDLALFYHETKNLAKAEPYFLEAIATSEELIIKYFPFLSDKEKQEYYALNKNVFATFERFCLDYYKTNPAILNKLYDLKLVTKGLLFNSSTKIREHVMNSNDKELIQTLEQLNAAKDFLAKVYKMDLEEKGRKGINEERLEEEANTLEKKLSLKSELFAHSSDKRLYKWHDVKRKLADGEAAVEILRMSKKVNGSYVPVYAALILTNKSKEHPDLLVLNDGDELEKKTAAYYHNAIQQRLQDTMSYNRFWKPIASKINGAHKVYISADGVYHQINLNSLYNPKTGKHLIDEIEIQLVNSTKDLVTQNKPVATEVRNASLFGYPDYNHAQHPMIDTARLDQVDTQADVTEMMRGGTLLRLFNGEDVNELPGTKKEVEYIESILQKKNSVQVHKYLYDSATEVKIKRIDNPQVLHIATHGYFIADLPTTNQSEKFGGIAIKRIIENPLLRSGLLFAGASGAFKPGQSHDANAEDGILTAYEAMSLRLNQTDLVVLSACETGLGVESNGEGVYGLQRAFQEAGAKTILMSLWKISDDATQELMDMFYRNWLGGKSPRVSFRLAQLSLRAKYPEPFYWGSFVLVGD